MATDQKDIERELGNALADRMGLYPPTTLREYEKEEDGNHVVVTMHTVKVFSKQDYDELHAVAIQRAAAS